MMHYGLILQDRCYVYSSCLLLAALLIVLDRSNIKGMLLAVKSKHSHNSWPVQFLFTKNDIDRTVPYNIELFQLKLIATMRHIPW
jgi:hypothetical protein